MNKFLEIFNSKWNPFGNYDDPIPPEKYLDKYGWFAYIYWYFIRNPLHNFCYYWIGTGNHPSEWEVWHSKSSWNLILPFFSFRCRWFEFYIGARPKSDGSQIWGISFRKRGSK
ncbi:hypothetical protein DRN73_10100 [Candidatus Pacearchaeota archaeon]|nr:MAG: hypothetical protein DRN73_10100 [Candidatus Pacearchaeota archaeon]